MSSSSVCKPKSPSLLLSCIFSTTRAFKGALFLTAGTVEHEAGTRDLRQLGGLRPLMPTLTLAATLASLSMAGLPPLGGFLSKELFYEGVLEADLLLTMLAVTASCLTFLYSFIFFHGTFFAPAAHPPEQAHSSHTAHHSSLGLIAADCRSEWLGRATRACSPVWRKPW